MQLRGQHDGAQAWLQGSVLPCLRGCLPESYNHRHAHRTPMRRLAPFSAGTWTLLPLPARHACAGSGRPQRQTTACGTCTASACKAGQQQRQQGEAGQQQQQEEDKQQQQRHHRQLRNQGPPQLAQQQQQQLPQRHKRPPLTHPAPAAAAVAGSSLPLQCGSGRSVCCAGAPIASCSLAVS